MRYLWIEKSWKIVEVRLSVFVPQNETDSENLFSRKALKLGSSVHWSEILYILSGSRDISADSLLLYYQPLIDWLQKLTVEFNINID